MEKQVEPTPIKRAGRPKTYPIRVVIELLPKHLEQLDKVRSWYGDVSRQRAVRILIEQTDDYNLDRRRKRRGGARK